MSRKTVKTPLIYALEPRLLFDGDLGADVASAIVYRDGNNGAATQVETDAEAPAVAPENQRENITFEFHSARTAIVFIDGALEDTQTLVDAVPASAEVHILNGDRDGFDQINEILENHDRVDEIHIFGHGAAGEARLGTASLSLETLTTHSDTLAVLKDTLTEDGDILLYGCNIAAGEDGEAFIEELAELTAADIAASDDVTGAGGDWELEVATGAIEAQIIKAVHYSEDMALTDVGTGSIPNISGVTKINNLTTAVIDEDMSSPNVSNANSKGASNPIGRESADAGEYYADNKFYVLLEQENMLLNSASTVIGDLPIDEGSQKGVFKQNDNTGYLDSPINQTIGNTSTRVNSYLVFLNYNNKNLGNGDQRRSDRVAQIVFDGEILGIFHATRNTWDNNLFSHSTAKYHYNTGNSYDDAQDSNNLSRNFENTILLTDIDYDNYSTNDYNGAGIGSHLINGSYVHLTQNNNDFMTIGDYQNTGDNRFMQLGASNTNAGDFIRVITEYNGPPTVTSATEVTGAVTELTDGHADENTATLTDTGSFAIADSNGDTVTVSRSFSSTTHSSNSAFGDLTATIANNTTTDGTGQINWTYSVDDSALDALDAGESYTETWTITVSDGTASTTQNVTVTINGAADPVIEARDDFASVNEGATVTADILSGVLHTTDTASQDTGDNLSVQSFRTGNVEGQGTSQAVGNALPGTYGSLTLSYNGNYSYTANSAIAGLGDGDTLYDYFNYTAVDSFGNTDTAVLRVTISGQNTAPTMTSNALLHTFTEADDAAAQALSATGTITLSDDDATNLSVSSYQTLASTVTLGGGLTSIPSALQTALEADNALSISHNTGDTTATWTFNVAAQDLDFLKYGETITVEETIQINDNQGGSITETIQVVIQGRDDKPTSANVVRTINESQTYTFLESDFTRIDVDGGTQAFDLEIEAPTNGTLRVYGSDMSSGGVATVPFDDLFADSITFTPDTGESGQNYSTVTFKIASDQVDQDEALGDGSYISQDYTFTFHVNAPPIVTAQTSVNGTVTEFPNGDPNEDTGTHTITGSFDIADTDSSSFTLSYETSVQWASEISTHNSTQPVGTFTLSDQTVDGTGSIEWTYSIADYLIADKVTANGEVSYLSLDSGESFAETFTVTIDDGDSETVTQDVVITVNGANDFDAQDDFAVVAEGGSISVGDNAGQSVGNPITDASSTFDAAFGGDENVAVEALAFNNDGSKLYLLENNSGRIQQHTLSTQFDASTASEEYTTYDGVNWSRDLVFNADGTKAFTINPSTDIIYEYNLTTAFDITTMELANQKAVSDGQGTNVRPKALDFSSDGTKLFYIDQEGQQIIQENLGTAYDTSTASLAAILDISEVQGNGAWGEGFVISPDGRKMFATSEGNHIYEWILHTPNDITSATFIHDRDLSSFGYNLRGLAFSNDGSKLFFANKSSGTSQDVVTFNTSVPFSTFYDEPSHSGDVINTNREETLDTGGNLDVVSIRTGATRGAGTPGTLGTPLLGAYGSLTMHANGSYTYQANDDISNWDAGKVGYDQFNYTINQGDAANGAAHAVLTIKVVAQDDPPTVSQAAVDQTIAELDDASSQDLSRSGTITFADDLDNYLTITGAASASVTAGIGDNVSGSATLPTIPSALQAALEGAFSITDNNDNTASWSLDVADLDLDFLKYDQTIILDYVVTATDDGGQTVTDTITITLTGTDDKPTSVNVVRDINKNGTYTFVASDFAFSDLDGGVFDTLEINGTSTGTLSDDGTPVSENEIISLPVDYLSDPDYSLTYTPAPDEVGQNYVSLTFTVYSDQYEEDVYEGTGSDASQEYTFTFNVNNSAPVASDITATVFEDSTTSGASRVELFGPTSDTFDADGYQTGHHTVTPLDLTFSPDGNTLFVLAHSDSQGNVDRRVVTYDLDQPWDVSAWTFRSGSEFDLVPPLSSGKTGGMVFNDDGTKMYVSQHTHNGEGALYSFNLSTAYDPSTATHDSGADIAIPDTSGETRYLEPNDGRFDLDFSHDGLSMFVLELLSPSTDGAEYEPRLLKYSLSTAWDVSTADMDNPTVHSFFDNDFSTRESGFAFGGNGTKLFVIHNGNNDGGSGIREYSLATPYDISNMTEVSDTSLDGEWISKKFYNIELSADNTKLFLSGFGHLVSDTYSTGAYIYQFDVYENPALSNDTDADGDPLTLTHIGSDAVASGTTYQNGKEVNGQYGVLTIGADGSYRYVANNRSEDPLDAGETVTDTFAYTVSDGTATDTANLVFTVIGVNDPPTATNNTVTINEDATKTFAASDFNFVDVDGDDSLDHITIVTLPATGTLTLSGSAVNAGDDIAADQIANLVYTPVADENGDPYTSFTFTVNDGTADSTSSYTMTIDVTPVNDAPTVATPAADLAIDEAVDASNQVLTSTNNTIVFADDTDTSLTITAETSSTVTASNGVTLSTTLQNALAGAITLNDNNDNTADWTLNADGLDLDFLAVGDSITIENVVTATDDDGETVTDTITVIINGTNDAPTSAHNTVTVSEDYNFRFYDHRFSFSDIDGDTLDHITIHSLPDKGRLNQNGTFITDIRLPYESDNLSNLMFYPGDNENGDPYTSFTFTVNDGTADSASIYTMTINITPVNDAPTAADDTIAAISGTDTTGTVLTNDSDPDGTTPTVSAIETGSTAGGGTPGTVGTALPGTYGSLTLDADGAYTYAVDANNADVLALGADDAPLTETFTYTITDGTATDTATITVNVSGVNDAPTVDTPAVDPDFNEDVDASAQDLVASGTIIFEDGDNTELSITGATSATVTASNGVTLYADLRQALEAAFSITTDGNTATWTLNVQDLDLDFLDVGDSITLEYDVTAEDDVGETVTDTITVTINGTNDAPRFAGTKTQTTNGVGSDVVVELPLTISELPDGHEYENSSYNFMGGFWEGVWDDGSHLEMSVEFLSTTHSSGEPVVTNVQISNPEHLIIYQKGGGFYSTLGNVHDSDLDYLAAGESYTDTFRISASDIHGATATQDFQIIVNGANDAPVLQVEDSDIISETTSNIADDVGTTITTSALEFFARESASSGINEIISTTDPDGGTESQSIVDTVKAAHIAALIDGNTFSSELYDNTNYPYAQHPDAQFHTYSTTEHNVNFDLDGTYANGSVVVWNRSNGFVSSRDRINGTTVELFHSGNSVWTSAALNRTQGDSEAKITVTPPSNIQFDQVRLNFPANSQNLREVQIFGAEVTTGTVDAGASQTATVAENTTAVLDFTGTDVDTSDTLAYSISGTDADDFTIDTNTGELTFTSAPNYETPTDDDTDNVYNLTVTVSDGIATDSTDVTITVTDVDEPLTAADDTINATSGIDATGTVLTNDSDPDGTTPTVSAIETGSTAGGGTPGTVGAALPGTYGSLTLDADGAYTYAVDANNADVLALGAGDAPLTETFTYTITDGTATDTATITVNVSGVNDAPTQTGKSGGIYSPENENVLGATELFDQQSLNVGAENDYTHTSSMYINFVDADGDALTVTKTFDSYTVSPNPYPYDAYARHTGAPYGNLTATIEETNSNDGGEWRVNLTYTVEDSDLDILADGEFINQLYTISVSDGAASFSTEVRVQLNGRLDIYAADDFATVNEGASISVNAGETSELADAKFTSANSPLNIDTFYDSSNSMTVEGVTFNNDGTKMYLTDTGGNPHDHQSGLVHNQYTLSTPFDISTATPDDKYLDAHSATYNLSGTLEFNNDGTKAFNLHRIGPNYRQNIVEYSLETPYEIDTATEVKGTGFDNPKDIAFNHDGTKMIYLAQGWHPQGSYAGHSRIIQYDLSTPYDLDTATNYLDTYEEEGDVLIVEEADPGNPFSSIEFSPDGRKLFLSTMPVNGDETYVLHEWFLHTPFDITTASKIGSVEYSSLVRSHGLEFNNDGTKVYIPTQDNAEVVDVHEYDAQVPFSQFYQVGGHSGDAVNNDRGTSNQIISVRKGSIKGSGDEGTLGQSLSGDYGALTLHADGSYTYVANSDIDGLDENEVVYDQFNYTVEDASEDSAIGVITITINGINSNTPPTIETSAVDPSISEAVDASSQDLLASGTITFADDSDTDLAISGAASSVVTTGSGVSIPSIAMQIALEGAISVTDNGDNTATWQLDASSLDLDFLDEGETITLEYAVTAEDDDGETVTDNVTVTITGTNDAPIAVDDTGNVEVGTEFSGNVLTANMSGEDVDLDAGDSFQVDRLTGFGTAQVISNTPGSSVTAVGTYGTITLGEDGSVTYNADQAAAIALGSGQPAVSETFNYRISDTAGETGTGTITFTVSGINDAPAVSDDNGTPDDVSDDIPNAATVSTVEDTPHNFGADDFNFTDIDTGDTLASVTITSLPDKGTLTLNGAEVTLDTPIAVADLGNLVYTPVDDENGDGYTSFAYTVSDGELDSPAATMTINVSPDNDAPVAADDTSNILVGSEYIGNVLSAQMGGEDTDPDGVDTLTVSALGDTSIEDNIGASATVVGTYGTLVLGRDGSVTYNADQSAAAALNFGDDAVTDTFTYTVSDGNGGSDSATVTFSVTAPNPGNTPPTAADNALSISEDASLTFSRDQFNFNDADGDRLRQVTIVTVPNVGSLMIGSNPVNPGDTITAGQIETLSYSPAGNAHGSDYTNFTFRVNDGEVDSVDAYTMNIDILPVNDAPTASDNSVTIEEDATKSFSAAEFGFADIDDGDSLQHITIATLPTTGTLTLSGATVNAGDNIAAADIENLVYAPVADANGAPYADFTFTVNDGTEDSAAAYTMTVNVTPLNDAPKVIDDKGTPDDTSDDVENAASISTPEDVDREIGADDLNFTDIDVDDSLASVTITALPSAGTLLVDGVALTNDNLATLGANITAAQLADNELVFRPEPGNSGVNYADFTFTVSDGEASSAAATMTVDVTPENDAPVVVAITDSKTEDDTAFNTDLLSGQSDPEGDGLSIASPVITAEDNNGNTLTLPEGAASVSGNELRLDPTLFNGLDDGESAIITVTYDVSDGALSEQNTATITITGVNDAPTISPLTIANSKDDANYRFDLLQGAEDLDGDSVSITGTPEIVFTDKDGNEVPLPAGAATLIDNEVEISPTIFSTLDVGEDVVITVNYDITDGDETVSNSATITISGDNTPPQIIDDNGTLDTSDDIEGVASVRIDEDTPHDFTGDDFNFADENEGDTLAQLTILSLPEKGTLLLGGNPVSAGDAIEASQIGNLTYAPAENDHGDDYASFTYSVNDGTDDSPIGTMAIHVNAVNDLPTSADAHLPLNGQEEVPLSADNFAFADADADDGDLDKVIIVTAPTEGTLFLNNQPVQDGDEILANQLGRLSYKPGDNASGENYDAFTFKVNDGEADSANSYTMRIGVNAPPVATPSSVSVTEGRPADGTLDATDPDDTDLTYRITRQPEHGTVRLIDGGPDYIYTPDDHYYGSDSFKFEASDGSQTSDEAEVSLTIAPVNNAPIERLTVGPQVIMVDGKVKPIKLRDFFADVDAFDPDKPRFQNNVANLYEKGTYPNSAKFDDIPPEGDLTFTVESELPPGLTFNGESISGRPTEPGVYDVVMKATDGLGLSALSSFKIYVGMPITDVTIDPPTQDPQPRDDSKPEETAPDLNDHDLPKVLKVNPKRDGSVPTRTEMTAEIISDDNPVSDMGGNASLSDDGWMDTKVSSEQDVSGNIRVVDLQVKGDEFAVQIADEAIDRAENFKGEMADGSNLPDWVNVDPDTGLTTATPPEGAKPIEMRIIAADSSGNERAIDLVLNPEAVLEVEQDDKPTREERREARQERREARQAERQARIEAREERRAERAEKRAFREFSRNNSEVSVLSDGRVRFTDGLTAAGEGAMKLMRMVTSPEAVTIEITDEMRGDTTRYEVRRKDGSDVPDWVQVDAATGELVIEATENVSMLELTLIAVDGNNQRSIELEINLDEMNEEGEATEEDLEATDEIEAGNAATDSEPVSSFTPLDDQIDAALTNSNYGQDLQTAMQTRV